MLRLYKKEKCRSRNRHEISLEAGKTNKDLIQSMLDENDQSKNNE